MAKRLTAKELANFEYPLCQVCLGATPTHTKRGRKLEHSKRIKAKSCNSSECISALLRLRKPSGKPRKPNFVRPIVHTALDEGFHLFNLTGSRL